MSAPSERSTHSGDATPERVVRRPRARAEPGQVVRDADEAGARGSVPVDGAPATVPHDDDTSRFVVAVEVLPQQEVVAHLLLNIGELTSTLSMTVCGQPAEYLAVLPGRQWQQVDEDRRCAHCRGDTAT